MALASVGCDIRVVVWAVQHFVFFANADVTTLAAAVVAVVGHAHSEMSE